MKALYPGDCPLCGLPWAAGEPIAKWLGKWSHEGCKALRRASIASEGKRTTLPDAPRQGSGVQVTGIKSENRKGFTRFTNGVRKMT